MSAGQSISAAGEPAAQQEPPKLVVASTTQERQEDASLGSPSRRSFLWATTLIAAAAAGGTTGTSAPAHGAPLSTAVDAANNMIYSVLDHGVVADVSSAAVISENQASIESAAAALGALGGGVLFFPRGKYYFHHIGITADNITLAGEGDSSVLSPTYLPSDNVWAVRMIGNNVSVRDLKIEAENKLGTGGAGYSNYELLRIGGPAGSFRTGAIVSNVTFVDGGGCNAYNTSNVVIQNSRYTSSHGNSFGSVNVLSDVLIRGNTATDGNDDLVAVTCDSNVSGGTKRVIVTSNNLARTDAKCIGVSGIASGIIANNHCEDSFAPGIQVFVDASFRLEGSFKTIVANNVVLRGGKWFGVGKMNSLQHVSGHGIHLIGDDLSVKGNTVMDSNVRGISLSNGNRCSIQSNEVINSRGVGINSGNPDNSTFSLVSDGKISGNLVINSGGGAIYAGSGKRLHITDNHVSGFKYGNSGESRGIYYGYLEDSTISNNSIINTDAAEYGFRSRPGSSNPQTRCWNNPVIVPGAESPDGTILTLNRRISFATTVPATGSWMRGDIVFNSASSSAAGTPVYWVCTLGGTPGAWLASSPANILPMNNAWSGTNVFNGTTRLGSGSSTLGFYGSTGSTKQVLAAPATTPASTQALANDLRAKLISLGLFS